MKENKKGVVVEGLIWWIIGISVLVIFFILIYFLKGKLSNMGDYIKNLFRF